MDSNSQAEDCTAIVNWSGLKFNEERIPELSWEISSLESESGAGDVTIFFFLQSSSIFNSFIVDKGTRQFSDLVVKLVDYSKSKTSVTVNITIF